MVVRDPNALTISGSFFLSAQIILTAVKGHASNSQIFDNQYASWLIGEVKSRFEGDRDLIDMLQEAGKDVEKFVEDLDADGDGEITLEEFAVHLFLRQPTGPRNPLHSDIIEGARNRASDTSGAKTVLLALVGAYSLFHTRTTSGKLVRLPFQILSVSPTRFGNLGPRPPRPPWSGTRYRVGEGLENKRLAKSL